MASLVTHLIWSAYVLTEARQRQTINILALCFRVKLEFKITHPHQIKEAKIPQGLRLVLKTLIMVHILDDRMSRLDNVLLIPY